MLSIEDCLERLDVANWEPPVDSSGTTHRITDPWDRRFISDICMYTRQGKPISTAQGDIVVKMVRKYINLLEATGIVRVSLEELIANPHYRQPLYQSTKLPREVRWLGDNRLGFRCKFNAIVVEDIKKLNSHALFDEHTNPRFNKEYKIWIVMVTKSNIDKTMELIKRHNFGFDPLVEHFFLESINSLETPRSEVSITDEGFNVLVRNDQFLQAILRDTQWLDD